MKVVILAGGKGTRLAELTHKIPKPMVQIGDKPMLGHIIDIFEKQAMRNFVIAAGYKKKMIESWANEQDSRIQVIDTGEETLTGGRIKRAGQYVGNGPFIMTYGDGVANVDITHVWNYHTTFKPLVTLTAVRPPARFGSLRLDGAGKVLGFHEKNQAAEGWVNGGFMIIEKEVLDMIEGDDTNFEKDVLPQIAEDGKLQAYFHTGFWQCMDTIRDVELLRQLYDEGAPWIKQS
jgi:glucose-1-phosphate cytidylyltransferase